MQDDAEAAAAPTATDDRARGTLTIAILAGGLTHERDVSVRSGRRVAGVLRDAGHTVRIHDVDDRLIPELRRRPPDVVWPLVHGSTGEDGSLQHVLDLLGIPYVGSDAAAARLASQKPVAKTLLRRAGVRTPDSATLPQSVFRQLGARQMLTAVLEALELPLVVKPADGGSALGVTIVTAPEQLPQAMVTCFAYTDVALIERFVAGTEVAVSVLDAGAGPRALPPVEILTDGAYDYDARYNPGRTEYFVPARLGPEHDAVVREVAVTVHEVLGLRHLSRTDLVVDRAGQPWFFDVNVAPGMTETSLFPQSAQAEASAAGTTVAELYTDIVRAALTTSGHRGGR